MRTVGGMLVFPVIAAIGGAWLLQITLAAGSRPARLAIPMLGLGVLANTAYFVRSYFVLLPPLARRIARASWLVAECLSLLRPLRSHYCALIRPRPTKTAAE